MDEGFSLAFSPVFWVAQIVPRVKQWYTTSVTVNSVASPNTINNDLLTMQSSSGSINGWGWGMFSLQWIPVLIALIVFYCVIGNARDRYTKLYKWFWGFTPMIWALMFFVVQIFVSTCAMAVILWSSGAWTNWHTGCVLLLIFVFALHMWQLTVLGSCNSNGIYCRCDSGSGCHNNNSGWGSKHGFNFVVLIAINVLVGVGQAFYGMVGVTYINGWLGTFASWSGMGTFVTLVVLVTLWWHNGGNCAFNNCKNRQSVNGIPTYSGARHANGLRRNPGGRGHSSEGSNSWS